MFQHENQTHQRNSVKEYIHTANINFTSFFWILLLFFYLKMVINMKNNVKLNENTPKVSNIEHCAFAGEIPKELYSYSNWVLAGNGQHFGFKQPLCFNDRNRLKPANYGGEEWHVSTLPKLQERLQASDEKHKVLNGFGFQPAGTGIYILDIDHHEEGEMPESKKSFIEKYSKETYAEVSISGKGYHLLFRVDENKPLCLAKETVNLRDFTAELYGGDECRNYMFLTGKKLEGSPDFIEFASTELLEEIKHQPNKNREINTEQYSSNDDYLFNALSITDRQKHIGELLNGTLENYQKGGEEAYFTTNIFVENGLSQGHHFSVNKNGNWHVWKDSSVSGGLLQALAVKHKMFETTSNGLQIRKYLEPDYFDETRGVLGKIEIIRHEKTESPVFDVEQLPGWLKDYVEFVQSVSISYPEFNYIGGVQLLSFLAGRMFYYELPWELGKEQNLSFYTFMLGLSGSVKSGAFTNAEKMRELILRNTLIPSPTTVLPKSFSKEAFEVALVGNVPKTVEEREEQKTNQKNSNGSLWFDECSGFLMQMNGKGGYLSSFKEKLMDYWSGSPITIIRKNPEDRTKNIEVISELDTRLSVWLATTFESFDNSVPLSDLKTGFITRFLMVAPRYKQERIKNRDVSKAVEVQQKLVSEMSKTVYRWHSDYENNNFKPIKIVFTPSQIDSVDDWYFDTKEGKDDLTVSYLGKLQNYIFKLAALFQIIEGTGDYVVSDENFERAFRLIEDYHLPIYIEVSKRVALTPNRLQSRIIKALEDNGGRLSRRDLYRKTHPKTSKEFTDAVNMLQYDMEYITLSEDGKYYSLIGSCHEVS